MNEAQVRQYEDIDLLTKHQIDAAFGPIEDGADVYEGVPSCSGSADLERVKAQGGEYAEWSDHHYQ